MPSPAGTVPSAWRTVLRLALAARFRQTMSALADLLRGRRLRGWNRISLAAAEHLDCYQTWIAAAEPALLAVGPATRVAIAAVLLGGDDAATRDSIIAAFGPDVAVFGADAAIPAEHRPTWLLPIRSGDRVSAALGGILNVRLRGCDAPLVYWDEDRIAARGRLDPWIKPDWDPILFSAHDGLVGSCVVRADVVPLGPVHDWAALTYEIAAASVAPVHIAAILTHRIERRAPAARAAKWPLSTTISVIVPTRDHADLLEVCLQGLSQTRFPGDHEILIVDNGSREQPTLALFERLQRTGRARVLPQPGPFNFAALANAGVAAARSDLVCLLNNDIEIGAQDWLEPMAALALRVDVGAVGARLLYPDGAIQHAGVALGIGDAAGHVDKGVVPIAATFAPWHDETRTVSAVTAACLLVQRAKYTAVGGMDADTFTIDFNDVDLCLRLAARGWRTVYCAEATLIHHESRSRGAIRAGADLIRFDRELDALRTRWATIGARDPFHSPVFRRQSERCVLAF